MLNNTTFMLIYYRESITIQTMEKVIKEANVYHGKTIDVVVYTIEYPTGEQAVREIVHHPGGVTAIPMLADNRILFVRQYRYPAKRCLLELPAGKVDPNETPDACVVRELEEETGFRAQRVLKLCQFYPSPGFCDEILHIYLATDLVQTKQSLELGEDSLTVETLSLDEAIALIRRGQIEDGKSIIALLWLQAGLHIPSS